MTPASKSVAQSDEFAAAMQQLSAEAAKSLPALIQSPFGQSHAGSTLASDQLEARLQQLENKLVEQMEKVASGEVIKRFEKIDEQLAAIRSNDSVNQQLFDSMHSELRKYRDNFLHESLQKPFIHDLVILYDDLNSLSAQLRSAADEKSGKRGHVAQWRDNLENAVHSLVEILHRFEVHEIEAREFVDRALHKVISFEPADFAEEDGRIIMRVRRGFMWRGKLVRPEEVIAKRFG